MNPDRLSLSCLIGFLLLMICTESVLAQKTQAFQEISLMKDEGLILVLLPDRSILIEQLQKKGLTEQANYYSREQDSLNRLTIQAFSDNFLFCDVLFFRATHLENVLKGEYDNRLMDAEGKSASSAQIKAKTVYFCHPEKIWMSSVEQGSLYSGISLTYPDQRPLPSTFPYYVRKHEGLFFLRRSSEQMVTRLNKKLEKFYEKSLRN